MSVLRNEVVDAKPGTPSPQGGTAYLMILNAVEQQRGLVHGKLHNTDGEHCAIGSFFDVNGKMALSTKIIDEVAAVNDSMPHLTRRQRKLRVLRWLRWRLHTLGMPGYERAKP